MVKKRELLLSIDDLKKLGIIKKYLRKRRRNKKRLKQMNNNIKQNSDHKNGYSEPVITNQQQIYRNNDLDNQIKHLQIENYLKTNNNEQLLLENNDYFKSATDKFDENVKQFKDQMNKGVGEINNIYKMINKIKLRPIELIGKNENIETVNEKNVFEILDEEIIDPPIETANEQPIETANEQPIETTNEQPTEKDTNTVDDMINIVEEIQNLRDILYEKTKIQKYLDYNYQISKRTITTLTNQLNKVKAEEARKQKEEEEMIKKINRKQRKLKKKL